MTQIPQPQQMAAVDVTVEVAPGPDGKAAVWQVISTGLGRFLLCLPADKADEFIDGVAAEVKAKAADARRLNSGLLIAPSDALNRLANGHRPWQPPSMP